MLVFFSSKSNSKIDETKIRSLTTCEVDGRSYRLGQRIYPENACYECLCTPDYNNSSSFADNSNCKKINCGKCTVICGVNCKLHK